MEQRANFEKDPWLVKEKLHMEWAISLMRGLDAGELEIFVFLTIRDRWLECGKWTYGYELSWVSQRDRGTIGHVLNSLFAQGKIESYIEWDSDYKRKRKWVKPTGKEIELYLESMRLRGKDDFDMWWAERHSKECECSRLSLPLGP